MIGTWCQIDENRFCQERECHGCQIYYLHLLDLNKKDVNTVKTISSTNSLAVPVKGSSISLKH